MFFLESIFSNLFSVDDFVCNISLCIFDMFWNKKETDNVWIIGIRYYKSG